MKKSVELLPEKLWILWENGKRLLGNEIRVGAKEEVFNPTHVTIWANFLVPIAERVRGASLVFLRLWQVKELETFLF